MNAIVKHELESVLRYEPETGYFFWICNRRGGAKEGMQAGTKKAGGYIQINVFKKLYYAHRLAWLFVHGKWPDNFIDHIDGDPGNNRISNLRDVSPLTNQQNQRRAHTSNKSSGLQGVSYDKQNNKWLAKISLKNKTKNLGRFNSPNLAHDAYIKAKRQLHHGATV